MSVSCTCAFNFGAYPQGVAPFFYIRYSFEYIIYKFMFVFATMARLLFYILMNNQNNKYYGKNRPFYQSDGEN